MNDCGFPVVDRRREESYPEVSGYINQSRFLFLLWKKPIVDVSSLKIAQLIFTNLKKC